MYHRIPKVTTTVSFGFSSIGSVTFWRLLHLDTKIYKFVNVKNIAKSILSGGELLLSGGRFFRGVVTMGDLYYQEIITFGGSLLSGSRYFRGVVTFGGSLLSGDRYFREAVTIGRSLLSGGRYYRGFVTFGVLQNVKLAEWWSHG